VTGTGEIREPEGEVHRSLANLQKKTALLPDYRLDKEDKQVGTDLDEGSAARPSTEPGTPLSGFVGGILTLLLAGALGLFLKRYHLRTQVGHKKNNTSL
ncbi:PDGLE domain-containing protein, partial [bacterium]|nr:PDGLE domain-containing protein [bacterium]